MVRDLGVWLDSELIMQDYISRTASNMVRDLGVWLDSELTMQDYISRTASSCFFHFCRLRQLRVSVVCRSTMQRLVSALILSRLDYCNAVLAGLPSTTLYPLRRVRNSAVLLVAGLGPRNHVTEQMKKLYWVPIKYRTNFKLCLMMHDAVTGQCPQYIRDILCQHYLDGIGFGQLLVAVQHPQDKNFFGERVLSVAGTHEWNTLPQEITDIINREASKRDIKTYYFKLACDC